MEFYCVVDAIESVINEFRKIKSLGMDSFRCGKTGKDSFLDLNIIATVSS